MLRARSSGEALPPLRLRQIKDTGAATYPPNTSIEIQLTMHLTGTLGSDRPTQMLEGQRLLVSWIDGSF